MSKVKKSGKAHYEMLYIIPNKFTEDEARKIDEKIQKIITDQKGKITYSENWGKKKLAYTIKHFNHGYYLLHEFDLDGKELKKVDTLLRLSNEVLRHQIVRIKKRTLEEIEADKKKSDELFKETDDAQDSEEEKEEVKEEKKEEKVEEVKEEVKEEKKEEKVEEEVKEEKKEEVKEEKKEEKVEEVKEEKKEEVKEEKKEEVKDTKENKSKKTKTDLKDLDKKLDDILETTDLL